MLWVGLSQSTTVVGMYLVLDCAGCGVRPGKLDARVGFNQQEPHGWEGVRRYPRSRSLTISEPIHPVAHSVP